MKCGAKPTVMVLSFTVVSFLSVRTLAARALPSPLSQAAAATLTGTVRAVDTEAAAVEMITGVGLALRWMSVQVDPASKIEVAGAPAELGDLAPGDIVRVRYRKVDKRNVAESIERVPIEEAGERR